MEENRYSKDELINDLYFVLENTDKDYNRVKMLLSQIDAVSAHAKMVSDEKALAELDSMNDRLEREVYGDNDNLVALFMKIADEFEKQTGLNVVGKYIQEIGEQIKETHEHVSKEEHDRVSELVNDSLAYLHNLDVSYRLNYLREIASTIPAEGLNEILDRIEYEATEKRGRSL